MKIFFLTTLLNFLNKPLFRGLQTNYKVISITVKNFGMGSLANWYKEHCRETIGPKFTDLHSSSKEMGLRKSCVSFGEDCMIYVKDHADAKFGSESCLGEIYYCGGKFWVAPPGHTKFFALRLS